MTPAKGQTSSREGCLDRDFVRYVRGFSRNSHSVLFCKHKESDNRILGLPHSWIFLRAIGWLSRLMKRFYFPYLSPEVHSFSVSTGIRVMLITINATSCTAITIILAPQKQANNQHVHRS